MSNLRITDLSRMLIELAWLLGPRGLNGECCEDLSMPEFIALDKVANTQDCPVQDIGQALGFTKSGATRIVNRLEKKGCIRRIKASNDARVCCVVITDRGKEILKGAYESYSLKFQNMLHKVPEKYASQMPDFLNAVICALRN